jgi:tRNA(adenine34) deaminase
MCLAACQQARVSRVVYGAKDPKGGALSLGYSLHEDLRTNHRFTVDFVAEPECGEILTAFFRNKRNKE